MLFNFFICDRRLLETRKSFEIIKSVKIAIFKFSKLVNKKDKMVGSNGTMIAIRLVRSKLRKREEHSNSVHPAEVVVRTAQNPAQVNGNNGTVPTQTFAAEQITYRGFWQYPPPPPQLPLYNNDQVSYIKLHKKLLLTHYSNSISF